MTSESLKKHPALHQWLALGPAGQVQVFSGKVDLGQGISHALRLIVAAELRLPAQQIEMVPASTRLSPDEAVTSGSLSVQHSGVAVRCAAAHLRENCRHRLAQQLGVATEDVRCDKGLFTSGPHSANYQQLADPQQWPALWLSTIDPTHVQATQAKQDHSGWSPTNTPVRPDVIAKVFGEFEYIQDRMIPGMCHGLVFRPSTLTADVIEADMHALQSELQAMPEVLRVVRDGLLLGVLAESENTLIRVAQQVNAQLAQSRLWQCQTPAPEPHDLPVWLKAQPLETTMVTDTTADAPAPVAMTRVSTEFHRPYLQHASIGLCCALAQWQDQMLDVWSHSQGIYNLRRDLALAFDLPVQQVQVSHQEGAGCYGHNGADDVAWDAAWLAQHAQGRAVRVQWTRQAELGHAPLAPAMTVRIDAELNPHGQLQSWTQTVWSQGHGTRPGRSQTPALLGAWQTAQASPVLMAVNAPMAVGGGSERNAQPPYDIDQIQVLNHRVLNMPFRVSAMRALGAPVNVMAAESVMDELAHRTQQDPLTFRLAHLQGNRHARATAVLQEACRMAAWSQPRPVDAPEGWGRGLGYARYKNTGAYCAVVVELVVAEKVRLNHLWIAADLGQVVDAEGAINQLEGGALQAASWALCEAAQLSTQGITSCDWDHYPILKFSDMPAVQVQLMPHADQPSLGAGECSAGPTCAAIANAIFNAIGVRTRTMPFTPNNLLAAIHDDVPLTSTP